MGGVLRVRPDDRVAGPATSGMTREQALATEDLWGGFVTTEPGMVSGWHHHGDHQTVFYVLSGLVRVEFGAGGQEAIVGEPGDFVFVPKGSVHRESNPGSEPADVVVVRSGTGESVMNLDGPEG